MTLVTISPKFQIVIPAEVRRTMNLTPGQKVQVIPFGNRSPPLKQCLLECVSDRRLP